MSITVQLAHNGEPTGRSKTDIIYNGGTPSTRTRNLSRTVEYRAFGSNDYDDVRDAVLGVASATLDGMNIAAVTPRPEYVTSGDVAGSWWTVSVEYASPSGLQVGDRIIRAQVRGESVHIVSSLETISSTAASGETAPTTNGAINMTADGVDGTDIIIPQISATITRRYAAGADLLDSYGDYVGSVNDNSISIADTFTGETIAAAAGELLLTGLDVGSADETGYYEATFQVGIIRNGSVDHPLIASLTKKGWEYLWFYYRKKLISGAHLLKPIAAFVERVYREETINFL